tara:strand:- start:60 stop:710 length:651 start_codon:yes stop_codon:yes gene_type:complete
MASASDTLKNLSVRPEGRDNVNLLMPKLQYRFRVAFTNFGIGSDAEGSVTLTRQVIDVARPQLQFEKITVPVYNSQIYLAGKHAWQPLTINIRDDASGVVSKAVGAQLQRQLDFYEQASAASGSDYKFGMSIDILDGGNGVKDPTILEQWQLAGCYLEQSNYNQLNYATSDVVSISLTISFDNAVQTDGAGALIGVGGPGSISDSVSAPDQGVATA